jgi:hypothetical protein
MRILFSSSLSLSLRSLSSISNKMPKTKTQNKTEVNGKGKELDDIVNGIIKKCKDTIVEYKNKKKNDTTSSL